MRPQASGSRRGDPGPSPSRPPPRSAAACAWGAVLALAVGCVSDGDSDSDADPGRPNSGEVVRGEGEGEGEGPAEGEGEGPAEGEGEDPAEGEGEGPAEGEGEGPAEGEGEGEGPAEGEGEGPAEGEGEGEGPAEGEGEGEGPGLACPAPGDCDPAVDAVEGELTPLDRCRFGWTPPDDWEGGMARVAALADRLPVVGWGDVLAQLNRRTRGAGATNRTAIPQLADGFTWNEGDDNVDYWMPQGVTGSSDAAADGLVAGRRLLLVSWYHKDAQGGGAQRGVRVSVVDWNLVGRPVDDYRHLLLVEPTVGPDGVPNFRAVEIHAGGIAWVGRWLFVADTGHGLRVFDMERVMEVATGEDHMGRQGERWYARGYRYIIPQVERYDALPEPEPPRQHCDTSKVSSYHSGCCRN